MAALPRLAAGLLLALVVVSSAQALVLVGPRETIPGSPGELVVSAGIVYVVTSTGLLIYDASDVEAGYALLGSHPGSFVTVEVRGTIAYVVGPGGLQIVDVRDPASPIGLGTLPTDRQSLDLEVVGTRAYIVVTPLGLRVVDVSHPATPALLGALDLDSQPSLHFAAVAVEGGVAYLNSVVGAVSVDVADPAAPALIARFDFGSPVFGADIAIRNHILYATADASAKAFPSLRILDVTDPAAPLELAHIDSACMDLALAGVVLYCTDSYQLHLFDVSDPSNPLALGVLRPGVMGPLADVAVARGIAHVATGPAWPSFESSLQAVDTRVRAFPARNGFSGNVPDSLSCLSIAGKHLYAGSSVAMDLFDIRDPMNPALVGSIRLPGSACDVIAVGWIAYTATETNLALVDVSDPSQPQLLTLLPSPARSLARAGNRLFVGTNTGSLQIYDVEDPTQPLLLGSLALSSGRVEDIELAGHVAYAAMSGFGVRAVDIRDPATPREIGSFPEFLLQSTVISGNLLYAGGLSGTGVLVLDASDPSNLRQIGAFYEGQVIRSLEILEDRLYVNGDLSLQVFDLSKPVAPVRLGGILNRSTFALARSGFAYVDGWDLSPFFAIDFGHEYAPTLEVAIDVLPRDRHNRVVVGKPRALPVAIFGSPSLDVRRIDRGSLALGPDGAAARISTPAFLNRDRWKDLLSIFWTPDTGIALGDTQVCLTGRLENGRALRGCDDIRTTEKGWR